MTSSRTALEAVRRPLYAVARAAWVVGAAGIFLMMVIICYDVLARYVLNQPTEWVFTLASNGLLAISFLAIPYLYVRDDHIAVDLVYDHLPRAVRVGASWATRVVAVVFGLVLTWYGIDLVRSASAAGLQTSGTFSIPVSWVSAPMAFGGLLLALVALVAPAPAVDLDTHPKEGVA